MTGSLTPRNTAFWDANISSEGQEITDIYGNRRFITVFAKACHKSPFWVRWMQSTSFKTIFVRSTLLLTSNLRLGLRILPSGFPYIIFDLIILIIFGREYKFWTFLLCSFFRFHSLHLPFFQDIIRSFIFRRTLSLFSSLYMKDQVLHPYKTPLKIIFLYVSIFTFHMSDGKTKDSEVSVPII
jgi:hypothetical protein